MTQHTHRVLSLISLVLFVVAAQAQDAKQRPAPQKIVEQALSGGRIVEHVADQRGLRGFSHEVAQTLRRRLLPLEKKCVHRRVARRQLRRMQIPALIEAPGQRVTGVVVMPLPCPMHHAAVLVGLRGGEFRAIACAMRADERGLVGTANMDPPGRQLDPDMVRRDLAAYNSWRETA